MRIPLSILLFAFLLASCGGSKKVISNSKIDPQKVVLDTISEIKEVVKDTIIQLPQEVEIENEVEEQVEAEIEKEEAPITIEVFNHSIWHSLLQEHVTPKGVINYEGFRRQKGILREYISSLGVQMPDSSWSQEDRLAYWMNAYNAMTVDLILRNLPLESIKDIDKPWNQRLWKLEDKWYNLDEIEHQILRKMDDPRIHFGINCASFSCPPLLNEAFTSKNVDSKLEFLAVQFVNDGTRNTISPGRIQISKIFNWFAKDFKKEGSLIDFLNKYSETPINRNARKSFKDYNWELND